MTVVPLATEVTCVCILAGYLLHYYGNWKKQHIMVTVAAFISWYFSLLIIFTLPIDVSNTYYRQCLKDHEADISTTISTTTNMTFTTISPQTTDNNFSEEFTPGDRPMALAYKQHNGEVDSHVCKKPWSWVPENVLPTFWRVVYWTSQVLTWLLLPLMQSYARAGDFTVLGKLKTALIENAIFYGTYLLIFGVCLIYLAIRPDISLDGPSLQVLAVTASNTWGLTLLVLMWGYGLVEVPRKLWNSSHRGRMLQYNYFKIAKLSVEKTEAEENLEDVLDDVKRAAETIKYNNPLRKHIETILEKCPDATREQIMRTTREDYQDFNNPSDTPTEKALIKLHKKVIDTTQVHQRTQCQWNRFIERAFDQEEVAMSEVSAHRVFRRSRPYTGKFKSCYNAKLEWYWKCLVYPWSMRILAVCVILLSLIVVWSECLFFITDPVLSIFAQFVQLAADAQNYFAIEFISFFTIAYLSLCAYFTVFKVRFFNYYYLAGHHQTNEYSLLFCGMMMCRLTPPLCLNFLGLIHLDSHITQKTDTEETYFTQIMGHMDVIKFISSGFNIYFPIAIVLLCFATYFNLCTRALHCVGFQQFIGDDEMTSDLVDEGKNLVMREKRKSERQEESASRRRDWHERYAQRTRGTTSAPSTTPSNTTSLPTSGGSSELGAMASAGRGRNEYGSNQPIRASDYLHAHALSSSSTSGNTRNRTSGGVNSNDVVVTVTDPTGREAKETDSKTAKKSGGFRRFFGGKKQDEAKKKEVMPPKEKDSSNEDPSVYSVTDGRTTAARSPQESDRSGLLKEAEPVDYSSPRHDPFMDDVTADDVTNVHGGYQSRAATRPTSINAQRGGRGPPRGIFDDI